MALSQTALWALKPYVAASAVLYLHDQPVSRDSSAALPDGGSYAGTTSTPLMDTEHVSMPEHHETQGGGRELTTQRSRRSA